MKKEKAIAAGAVVMLIVSLICTVLLYWSNKSLTGNLNKERLKSELMLSEKLELQKEIEKFKNQIISLSDQNTEIDKILTNTP
jgi:hypothetical protein